MQVILKNEQGEFTIGCNGEAKLLEINGLGNPNKETETVTYSGQAGQTTLSMRDKPRTITMTIDFYGNRDKALKLYRMVYNKIDIIIISGEQRRKITGLCIDSSDIEQIIYHKMFSSTLQFICDDPYFHDLFDTKYSGNERINKFPNLNEDNQWYVNLPAIATERSKTSGVLNKGAIRIYPIIEIYNNTTETVTSTTTGIYLTNLTTSAIINIERDMKPSEKITIDLPNRKIISDIDGDITKYISDDTVLSNFYLELGENIIETDNKNTLQNTITKIIYNNNYEAAII